jgi:hypothetical protein
MVTSVAILLVDQDGIAVFKPMGWRWVAGCWLGLDHYWPCALLFIMESAKALSSWP